jgi:hypothetical protein
MPSDNLDKKIQPIFDAWLNSKMEKLDTDLENYTHKKLKELAVKLGYKIITEEEFKNMNSKSTYKKDHVESEVNQKVEENRKTLESQLTHQLEKKDLQHQIELVKLQQENGYLKLLLENSKFSSILTDTPSPSPSSVEVNTNEDDDEDENDLPDLVQETLDEKPKRKVGKSLKNRK